MKKLIINKYFLKFLFYFIFILFNLVMIYNNFCFSNDFPIFNHFQFNLILIIKSDNFELINK